jgi:hypothetical protein
MSGPSFPVQLRPLPPRKSAVRCSFCGVGKDEAFFLMCAPMAAICSDCIDQASDALRERRNGQGGGDVLEVQAKPEGA